MSKSKIVKNKPDQVATKRRLLDAAEQLIAEKGFDAVSIRDVTGLAVANVAAVNYHFGNREGLLASVLDRHLIPLAQQRMALLQELTPEQDVRAVLRLWIQPLCQMTIREGLQAAEWYRILGRSMEASGMGQRDCLEAEQAAQAALRGCLVARLDEQQVVGLAWRLHFATGGLIHLLVHGDAVESPFSMVDALERWVETVAQGIGVAAAPLVAERGRDLAASAQETALLPSVAQQVATTMEVVAREIESESSAVVAEASDDMLPKPPAVAAPVRVVAPPSPARKSSKKPQVDGDLFLF